MRLNINDFSYETNMSVSIIGMGIEAAIAGRAATGDSDGGLGYLNDDAVNAAMLRAEREEGCFDPAVEILQSEYGETILAMMRELRASPSDPNHFMCLVCLYAAVLARGDWKTPK